MPASIFSTSLPADGLGEPDRDRFAREAADKAFGSQRMISWSDIFSRVLSERVEPRLGLGRA